jgi:hypothetical protein
VPQNVSIERPGRHWGFLFVIFICYPNYAELFPLDRIFSGMKHDESYYLRRAHQCAVATKQSKSWTTKVELFSLRAHYLRCLAALQRKEARQAEFLGRAATNGA